MLADCHYHHTYKLMTTIPREKPFGEAIYSTNVSFLSSLKNITTEENAERIMLDPTSRENPKFKDLVKVIEIESDFVH